MDYDFITTCNWTSTGTFTLRAYKGNYASVADEYTIYYRKKGSPTWSSTTNGQINITSTGEWEVANDWNKDYDNNVLTHSYDGTPAINACTSVYFNEETLGTTIGGWFLYACWGWCANLVSMPEGFNLPSGITSVGDTFLFNCWNSCTNLTSMPAGFNIPSGITTVGDNFFDSTWYNCTNLKQDGYTEDLVFEFNAYDVFGGSCPVRPQSITGASKANPVRVAVNRPQPPDVTVDVEPDEIVFTNPSVSVIGNATIDLDVNEIVFTNPSVDVAVQANIIIDVSANETNLNSLGVNITEGEGISFDTSTDQAIFTNLAIKVVEQGGGYSPLASILNFISPEITVETEYNWKDRRANKTIWS